MKYASDLSSGQRHLPSIVILKRRLVYWHKGEIEMLRIDITGTVSSTGACWSFRKVAVAVVGMKRQLTAILQHTFVGARVHISNCWYSCSGTICSLLAHRHASSAVSCCSPSEQVLRRCHAERPPRGAHKHTRPTLHLSFFVRRLDEDMNGGEPAVNIDLRGHVRACRLSFAPMALLRHNVLLRQRRRQPAQRRLADDRLFL